jgi:hypothetical protein
MTYQAAIQKIEQAAAEQWEDLYIIHLKEGARPKQKGYAVY